MANVKQGGFRFRRMRNGATRPPIEVGFVADSYGTALYKGDPVQRTTDGSYILCPADDTAVDGVMIGAKQYWDGTVMKSGDYLPATTVWGTNYARQSQIYIIPVTDAIFEVDAQAATGTTQATWEALIGENCDAHATYATASTTTGISAYGLDTSTHETGGEQWRIVDWSHRPDNDFTVVGFKLEVQANVTSNPPGSTSGV